MRLLLLELRKIWRPGVLAALVILGAVYYYIRPGFYIEYFANGPVSEVQYRLSLDWAERFGATIDREERDRIAAELEAAEAAFSEELRSFPLLIQQGVTDYGGFAALRQTCNGDPETPEALRSALDALAWTEVCQTVEAARLFLEGYDRGSRVPAAPDGRFAASSRLDRRSWERVRALESAGPGAWGFLPFCVLESTEAYARYLGIWCMVSAALLLSPTLVRDRLHRTRAMQWASRRGRRILRTQFAAALLSALLLTALNIALYAVPFLSRRPLALRRCPLYSVWPHGYPWFDWTYGQYLLALLGLILLLSLGASSLAVFLSRYSGNYVAMLLKAIPLIAAAAVLAALVMTNTFFFGNLPTGLLTLPGGEFLFAAAPAVLGLALCALACRRQGRRELL